ncbi:hypothetical protein LEP1GSC111_1228 [Leptospira interrogans str. UT126]|uniref:hypothetical protein n=1 Tax=Leptospira interrogans TaxID=173 RepID=UPI0002BE463D|nr:hypothetical protein [Leptospira interrogans]EMJ56548.1 hypothetical protein LEP1GSC111_1228 [Leptospira interrogans str. UT126]
MGLFPGVERSFTFELEGHAFAGNFPRRSEKRDIEVEVAQRLNFVPLGSISSDAYAIEVICVTFNKILTTKPKELDGIDFADLPDQVILKIWNKYKIIEKSYEDQLKKNNRSPLSKKTDSVESNLLFGSVSASRLSDLAERVDEP